MVLDSRVSRAIFGHSRMKYERRSGENYITGISSIVYY
jgi:hypothetical protein